MIQNTDPGNRVKDENENLREGLSTNEPETMNASLEEGDTSLEEDSEELEESDFDVDDLDVDDESEEEDV
jgi:hypothetical protein